MIYLLHGSFAASTVGARLLPARRQPHAWLVQVGMDDMRLLEQLKEF